MLGVRSTVRDNCRFENVVMMGADHFKSNEEIDMPASVSEVPDIGVGENSIIKNAIIDKNARIGANVFLSPTGLEEGWADEHKSIYSRDGILVIVKNAIVPAGTKIGEE
jgi:glucose-1-phosphate adenylyltransferase